ncbi:exodeoxyribonuclease V subunit beta [Colwelliaceae bacterium 6471]
MIKNLVAHQIPLSGKHLIEASAGTGKTFNITRIYLRLLLEQRLPVEQILVMTFTKDATEELRGRIDAFIRQAINDWQQLSTTDEFFIAIAAKIDHHEAQHLLKQALLFLDEAAIYTIHGFCKRVLSEHAFASGLAFNAQMEADCQDLILEACQDWYRVLAHTSPDDFITVASFWPDPMGFLSQFSKAISHSSALAVVSAEEIIAQFQTQVGLSLNTLNTHLSVLTEYLIDVKKGADREHRAAELSALLNWLEAVVQDIEHAKQPIPDSFIDGRRFSRSPIKAQLVEIFAPVNLVKSLNKTLSTRINKAHAFEIIRSGIYQIRAAITSKKQLQNMLNFDDLIATLANTLEEEQDHKLANRLFRQYPVALVDEFQDTDPLQFSILKAIYYHQPQASLYMIGDPKQAIYGFRGGDVFAYLSARDDCDHQWLMDTNWRSSVAMIQGYNRLFLGNNNENEALSVQESLTTQVFGYGIPYLPVKASPVALTKPVTSEILGQQKALQFVHFSLPEPEQTSKKVKAVPQTYRKTMAQWCANEIVRKFAQSPQLKAQDIAILVRDGAEADEIKQALQVNNLAAVFLSNRANLFHSEQCKQLKMVLKGILFVENERVFTAALASDLIGCFAQDLYELQHDELAWQQLKFAFIALRDEWRYKGFISMALKLMHDHFKFYSEDKDRTLTNLLHLFEILQSASQRHQQPQELLFWFEQQCALDNPEIEAELRLESDDNLIRIVTQHGSKGLEYPVVFVPFATRHKNPLRFANKAVNFIEYHDEHRKLRISLDGSEHAKKAMAEEAYAETIRLLYVAVTRAEQQCYIFTTPFDDYHLSPLGQTLKWSKGQDMLSSLTSLTQQDADAIGILKVNEVNTNEIYAPLEQPLSAVEVARFSGKIERDWWLSSFTALSKNLRHGGVSTPDRDADSALLTSDELVSPSSHLLRFNLEKGAHSGNLLHDILEQLDFSHPDWPMASKWPLLKYGNLPSGFNEQDLYQWLSEIIDTPLPNGGRLADLSSTHTLRESEFYYPMQSASTDKLTKLLTDHRNQAAHRITDKTTLAQVRLPAYKKLKGMMHGFIDLIFEHQGKYYLCDYKSSHLGDHFSDYQSQQLVENIEQHHYDLQYLIYALALHRQLTFCVDGYDPDIHFGGVYYFYLRGMTNKDEASQTAGSTGIYYRAIAKEELQAFDQLFSDPQGVKGNAHG